MSRSRPLKIVLIMSVAVTGLATSPSFGDTAELKRLYRMLKDAETKLDLAVKTAVLLKEEIQQVETKIDKLAALYEQTGEPQFLEQIEEARKLLAELRTEYRHTVELIFEIRQIIAKIVNRIKEIEKSGDG